jgi:hypothetical protein
MNVQREPLVKDCGAAILRPGAGVAQPAIELHRKEVWFERLE